MKSILIAMFMVAMVLAAGAPRSDSVAEEPSISDAPKVTKEEIKGQLGKPGFILLDCRPAEQWKASRQKLPGAVHEDPTDVATWAQKYPKDAKIVIY